MLLTPWMIWLGLFVFAGASFFFALAETALFSLSKWQIRQIAEREPRRGVVVSNLLGQPQDLLATMVLGNIFATSAMIGIAFWMALAGSWSLPLTVGAMLAIILLGCEVLPKTLAVRAPEKWSLRIAPLVLMLQKVTGPLRTIAQKANSTLLRGALLKSIQPQATLTESDYKELVELALQQGTLAQSERDTILQILSLDRRTAKEVMQPRSRMAAIPDDLSVEEMIAAAKKHKHRRLPMFDETPDTIVGILNTRTLLLDPQVDLSEAIEFPSFVPETMNLLQLLKSFQRQQRGMAIVLDEFGGTAGLVTMEDILGQLVGHIRGEVPSEGLLMEKLGVGRWRVNGMMRLDDFRREFPGIGDVAEVDTMGGLLTRLLDVVPGPGESAVFRGVKLTAQSVDERRVRELIVEVVK
jgi:putative hemolysin